MIVHYFFRFLNMLIVVFFFFFFQAEDGIRDWSVTGVQTCALPILPRPPGSDRERRGGPWCLARDSTAAGAPRPRPDSADRDGRSARRGPAAGAPARARGR